MASGQDALLKKNKDVDVAERIRIREDTEMPLFTDDGRARTRNQML